MARPHCNGGNGGDGRGTTIICRGIDDFVVRPILGVLLLLLLLDLICPLPREAVSNGQFLGQARQAQQRRDIGFATLVGPARTMTSGQY